MDGFYSLCSSFPSNLLPERLVATFRMPGQGKLCGEGGRTEKWVMEMIVDGKGWRRVCRGMRAVSEDVRGVRAAKWGEAVNTPFLISYLTLAL